MWNEKGALTSSVWMVARNNSYYCTTNRRARRDRCRGRSNYELKKKFNYASWCTYVPENIAVAPGRVGRVTWIDRQVAEQYYASSTKLWLKTDKKLYRKFTYKIVDEANHLSFLFDQIFFKNFSFLFLNN